MAVLVGAVHLKPDGPRTLIHAFATRSRPTDSIYIASRACTAWLFYTTNWAKADTGRPAKLTEAAMSIGPNSGNAAIRGHEVRNEGDGLKFTYRGRLELIGIPNGVQNTALEDQVGKVPDLGWADNEAERINAAAEPRIWVLVDFPDVASRQLLDAIALLRGKELLREETNDSTLMLYEFPSASIQIDGNERPTGWKSPPGKSRPGSLPARQVSHGSRL